MTTEHDTTTRSGEPLPTGRVRRREALAALGALGVTGLIGGRHTGQVFFNEQTTARVYRQAPDSSHGQPDTSHSEDDIYAQAGRSRAVMRLKRRTGGRRGYHGTIALGVAT